MAERRSTASARAAAGDASTASALVVREDEAPWTVEELGAVSAELESERNRLEGEIAAMQSNIADVLRDSADGAGDDQADSGSKAYEREQELTLLASTQDALYQTRHALARIADGTYGVCESCGSPIGKMRLQAFPRATLCVACKQRQERR